MLKMKTAIASVGLAIAILWGCTEPYYPEGASSVPDILVVDAFLDGTNAVATVKISKAVALTEEVAWALVEENPANPIEVIVEQENGTAQPATRIEQGVYRAENLAIDFSKKYRLNIKLSDNRRYVSEFVEVKQTPPIDRVFFNAGEDGVSIMVDTYGGSGDSEYFRWSYDETFEYTSPHFSGYKIVNGEALIRETEDWIYRCWRTDPSQRILIGSTSDLAENSIRNFELNFVDRRSTKLVVKYSINVRQHSLTAEGYTYWYNLKKTTENLGGLFDPMPGEVRGNIHNVADAQETVIGYFSASTVAEKRIFITPQVLPGGYVYYPRYNCEVDTVLIENLSQIGSGNLLISGVFPMAGPPVLIGYSFSTNNCVDCRLLLGGVLQKPSFWE